MLTLQIAWSFSGCFKHFTNYAAMDVPKSCQFVSLVSGWHNTLPCRVVSFEFSKILKYVDSVKTVCAYPICRGNYTIRKQLC